MGKVMKQIPFGKLMELVLSEYANSGSVFGIHKIYRGTGKQFEIFGEELELPFGPAAGPHTQCAQNIIAGYAAGARFFELKTAQTLDGEELPVSKPCISAPDECYNVEWSTEFYVPQAMDEYIKAWYALKLLSKEFGLGGGFVFNMSVGYDLEGIKSKKIDDFIEGLKNAGNTETWQTCKQWATENLPRFKHADKEYIDGISPEICRSITLSTLHGCPPEEIERIASYLITEKKLHTYVKCNPTLLGFEYARETLDRLGFDYLVFGDRHFKADLQFEDAVPMLERLQKLAGEQSPPLQFGVKLTNTFPVQIKENELPGEEMYMSGRALFPLSLEAANRLSQAFGGKLRISYSGGAEARNIGKLYDAGIWPITVATTLLKPGGYARLHQMAETLAGREYKRFEGVDRDKVQALLDSVLADKMYHKPAGQPVKRKMKAAVPLLDCFTAPCREGCPIKQDIPAYLRLAGEGKHLEALKVITARNPLPFITGAVCPQFCADKCARGFYEGACDMRGVKLEAAESAFASLLQEIENTPKSGGKCAVIGGGPAGLSAAFFLARAGRPVTVFEKRESLGGIVRHVIPSFRIGDGVIGGDIELIKSMGVDIRLNSEVKDIDNLRGEGFEHIIVASGARKPGVLKLEGGESLDALDFLEQLKNDPQTVYLGENVAIVGGGNTAMDAARAAKRIHGVKQVSLVYRRTKRYMPASAEEIKLASEDGVKIRELLSPVSWTNGVLTCEIMELGAPDASGRKGTQPTGKTAQIPADTVISAIGNHVDAELYALLGISTDENGKPIANADTLETGLSGVYVIGDAARGPSTVVESIADALICAAAITGSEIPGCNELNINAGADPAAKKGVLYFDNQTVHESERCLECASLCECCADVCPNRANVSVPVNGRPQIIHIDDLCNECGNCEMFCPYSSAPYKDKFTLFSNAEDFEKSENQGFLVLDGGAVRVRIDGSTADHNDGELLPEGVWELIKCADL
ncbi:MAG: putative selenate reductase subunit YgfK [Defluviitaleaceae bacterium]|nr:putative selenate reductase subunit YgfK [Defluviitaleaceae bacterium]MCL2836952.1 putative selenate reductase subunit YgfK [Defluviitaleaceae bacterium]